MRVLNILNLNRRKLNHHEEVYSQRTISEAASREQELGGAGIPAAVDGQSASRATAVVDDRASAIVDRGSAGSNIASICRTTVDDGRRVGGRTEAPWPLDR